MLKLKNGKNPELILKSVITNIFKLIIIIFYQNIYNNINNIYCKYYQN